MQLFWLATQHEDMHDDEYLTLTEMIGVLPGNTAEALFLYGDVIVIRSLSSNILNMSHIIILFLLIT